MNKKAVPVVIAILFALSVYGLMPAISANRGNTVQIGVIVATETGLDIYEPFFEQIIEPDINAYCAKLPKHRFNPPMRFDFVVVNAEYSADVHLQRIEDFHNAKPHGVDLIIGAPWSSFAAASLQYVNENDILLFSPSSTAPQLAIPDDNLFRLCPDDTKQGAAIAEVLRSKGVESIVVIQRDDEWGGGLYDVIETEFENRGGTILERIVYPTDTIDFTSYLQMAENAAVGASPAEEPVAIQLLSFSEVVPIVIEAENYTTIYDLEWFGSDATALSPELLDGAPEQAVKLKIYSTLTAPEYSSKYAEMAERFQELTGYSFSYYSACWVDIAWIIAQAVLETQSSGGPPMEAADIIDVIPDVTSRYFGYTGWCLLNEAGDRYTSDYDIWGYGMIDGQPSNVKYGSYRSATGEVTWN